MFQVWKFMEAKAIKKYIISSRNERFFSKMKFLFDRHFYFFYCPLTISAKLLHFLVIFHIANHFSFSQYLEETTIRFVASDFSLPSIRYISRMSTSATHARAKILFLYSHVVVSKWMCESRSG